MKKLLRVSIIVATLCVLFSVSAFATDAPAGVKQVDASTSSVKVQWDVDFSADEYQYQMSNDKVHWGDADTSYYSTSATIYPLNPGKTYYFRVRTVRDDGSISAWSNPTEVVTAPDATGDVFIKRLSATTSSAKFSWTKIPGSTEYKIVLKNYNTDTVKATRVTTANSITISNLSKDSKYEVEVYPIRKSATGYKASYRYYYGQDVVTVAGQTLGLKIDDAHVYSEKVSFKWSKKKNADGYQIQMYNYRTKKTSTKTVAKSFAYSSDGYSDAYSVDNRAFYKVRIRSYVLMSDGTKKCSAWSNYNYVNLQKNPKLNQSGRTLKATWSKVYGATGYDVYIANQYNGTYKKVGSTTGTSKTIKYYGKNRLSYGKTYYVKVVAKKKVNGKYYYGTKSDSGESRYMSRYS